MHPSRRSILVWLMAATLCSLAAAPAGAQCSNAIADGDVLVIDLTGPDSIIRVSDVFLADDGSRDLLTNQDAICTGGTITFPRSMDFDREGRIWVSMTDGAVRVDPPQDIQISLVSALLVPQRGILKERDGPVYIADPGLTSLASILAADNINGHLTRFTQLASTGVPLGLIFDPAPGASPPDMLLADSGNNLVGVAPGLYAINQVGGVTGIARNGYLVIPYRLASTDGNLVYLTDLGGDVDPDGGGPEEEIMRPPQVVRVDRSIAFDFEDDDEEDPTYPDGRVNQTVIAEGDLLSSPIGIVILEENGVNPDSLLVSDATSGGGRLIRIDFDPTALEPALTATMTIVAEGDLFVTPWEVKLAQPIDPQPRSRIYVTDTAALPADTGIVYIDNDGSSGDYVTGFTTPNAVVVDPFALDDLIVADAATGGTPSIQRVTPVNATSGSASPISSGDQLVEPMGIIVDADADILVADRGAGLILRVDGATGAQSVVSPTATTVENFLVTPVGLAIDPDGYLQVVDQGDGDTIGARVVRINPVDGKQFCAAESVLPGTPYSIDGIQDILFDDIDDASILSIQAPQPNPPLLRVVPGLGTIVESTSPEYVAIRQTATAENRDLLSVDANVPGAGRVLRLDPIVTPTPGTPAVVAGSENLEDPRGIAVARIPRPVYEALDSDADGILDPEDNCVFIYNPGQEDTNIATIVGDACDPPVSCDVNGDLKVGILDFQILQSQLGNDCVAFPSLNCAADCADPLDNIVGLPDFTAMVAEFGNETGVAGDLVGVSQEGCPTTDDP